MPRGYRLPPHCRRSTSATITTTTIIINIIIIDIATSFSACIRCLHPSETVASVQQHYNYSLNRNDDENQNKSLFILLLLLLPFSFFPTTHRAPSLPHHPWQSHKTPSISCILASHHFTIPVQPSPIPSHPMPCHAPRKKKETVLPPGPFYTVDIDIPSPLHETRYKIRGVKKKPQPSESLVVHFDGRLGGVGIFDGTFFFYDRQDWRRLLLSSLYTVQYILGRYRTSVSMYLGGTVL